LFVIRPPGPLVIGGKVAFFHSQPYNEAAPSEPISFAFALWGALPPYSTRYFNGFSWHHSVSGNCFICTVGFGKKLKPNHYWQAVTVAMLLHQILQINWKYTQRESLKKYFL
jgi:hypothetical protein